MRSFELSEDEDDFPLPARNTVCFVLDGAKVEMLANLRFSDDDARAEWFTHEKCKLQAVDIF